MSQPLSHVLTLVASADARLAPALIGRMREAAGGGEPQILAEGVAVDIPVAGRPDLEALRPVLGGEPIDLLATAVAGRRKSLLVADMDSTIITGETLDELAELAGSGEQVAEITRRSMNGELDFAAALRARVRTLEGVPVGLLEQAWEGVRLQPGARALVATMRRHGARCALVSGGFTFFTARVAALCGFDAHFANVLRDDGVVLAGEVDEPVLDRGAKLTTMRRLLGSMSLEAAVAVGDGANDLDMLVAAGLGVGYRPKPVLAAAVANRCEHADLRALLFAQGFRGDEIVEG